MNRLKELRKANRITQKEIADMFGISPSAVSFWESGKNNIDWRCATALAEKFHVTPEYLLGETDIIDSASIQAPAAVRIPVVGTIRAGIPLAAIEDIEDWVKFQRTWQRRASSLLCVSRAIQCFPISKMEMSQSFVGRKALKTDKSPRSSSTGKRQQ